MTDPDPSLAEARLHLRIDPDLDHQLRLACLNHQPRLSLREGVEEAIRLWLELDREAHG